MKQLDPQVVLGTMHAELLKGDSVFTAFSVDYEKARQQALSASQQEPNILHFAWQYLSSHCLASLHRSLAQVSGVPAEAIPAPTPATDAARKSAQAAEQAAAASTLGGGRG
eukprot:14252936-Alexandrium_andersonii.AAC.1